MHTATNSSVAVIAGYGAVTRGYSACFATCDANLGGKDTAVSCRICDMRKLFSV